MQHRLSSRYDPVTNTYEIAGNLSQVTHPNQTYEKWLYIAHRQVTYYCQWGWSKTRLTTSMSIVRPAEERTVSSMAGKQRLRQRRSTPSAERTNERSAR